MLPLDNLKLRDLPESGFMSKRKKFEVFNNENRFALFIFCWPHQDVIASIPDNKPFQKLP